MIRLRKWLILTHRYLGIVLSLMFVVWFLSGIGMIYAKDMPRLTAELRLERLAPLDFNRIRLTPVEAAQRAELTRSPGRMTLLMVGDHPSYRMDGMIVFADSGYVLDDDLSADDAVGIAARFMRLPPAKMHHAGVLMSADQWTIGQRRLLPLHKVVVDDRDRTQLYVSEGVKEVVVYTTRGTRALAWVAAIPHWL